MLQIVNIGPLICLHSSHFYPTPKVLCFITLFNRPDTPRVPLSMGVSIPHVHNCTLSQKTSHIWLVIIFTYTVRLHQFLAILLPRK